MKLSRRSFYIFEVSSLSPVSAAEALCLFLCISYGRLGSYGKTKKGNYDVTHCVYIHMRYAVKTV
jgi:hypothetical protein